MFVVSKGRTIAHRVLAAVAWIAILYWAVGIAMPVMNAIFRPLGATLHAIRSRGGSEFAPFDIGFIWPTGILVVLFPVVILLAWFVVPISFRYKRKVDELEYLNETLAKTDELQKVGGSVSYAARERYGTEYGSITRTGDTSYELLISGTNAFGETTVEGASVNVTPTSFSSNQGASFGAMRNFHAALELARMSIKQARKRKSKRRTNTNRA